MIRLVLMLALIVLCVTRAPAETGARPTEPGTSFQTAGGWEPQQDIRSDAAIVYTPDKATMDSWAKRGYVVQTMGGFRTGDAYIKEHPEEGQTTKDGVILTCGPGSYYMVPTERRIKAMVDFFLQAIENGSSAVIPEEPEFFASAGYSASFKDAWKEAYGEPWQDPASSFDARIRAEQLKGVMEVKMIRAILQAARDRDPSVRRMVAHHSPVNYHGWGISFPFDDFARMPELQEAIGQVWTGTARTPCMYRGETTERTFETALLEYSSLVEIYRDTGKRLWFLADPLEDNPDRTMEDYRQNYAHTVVASLMFPEVNAFELLPWPSRIYGRVPKEYATALGAVFNALGEISRIPAAKEPGSSVGVLIGDSAAYQRAEPSPGDLTGFYGLTLPLLFEGREVRVAPIERTIEPGYLRSYKVLVLSYDFFKPMRPEYNMALANWVREGGQLILIGGSNAYNGAEQWWKKAGFASPDEHLLKELGLEARRAVPEAAAGREPALAFRPLWKETARVRDLTNRRSIDVPFEPGSAATLVRFRDSLTDDGWGPLVTQIRITRTAGAKTIKPGSAAEAEMLTADRGSLTNPIGRFADGTASFGYLFKADPAVRSVSITAGNQAEVDWAPLSASQLRMISSEESVTYAVTQYEIAAGKAAPVKRSVKSGAATTTCRGFRAEAGKGAVEFMGLPADAFARTAGSLLCGAVKDAFRRAGAKQQSSLLRVAERGPYVAAHLLPSGRGAALKPLAGDMVDLLDARFPVIHNPAVKEGDSRLFRRVVASERPYVLAASYQTDVTRSDDSELRLHNTGPLDTPGALRIYTANRSGAEVTAADKAGKPVAVTSEADGRTLLVSFPGSPDGVTVTVTWHRKLAER